MPTPGRNAPAFCCSEDVDEEEGDVVLLWGGGGRPGADLVEKEQGEFGSRARWMVLQNALDAVVAEGFAGGVFGLAEAVGVKQEAVAGVERNLACGKVRGARGPEQRPVAFYALKRSGGSAPEEKWWMSGGGVARGA